jgi:hypothetical protein
MSRNAQSLVQIESAPEERMQKLNENSDDFDEFDEVS